MGFTTEQEDELWIRWRRGESSRLIGRALRCHPSSVRAFLARSGGVRPTPRRRSVRHLTATEREEVSRGIAAGLSARAIAALIGRSASTVSREIARNGGRDAYRAAAAEAAAWDRGRRPNRPGSRRTRRCLPMCGADWRRTGLPSRSPRGFAENIPPIPRAGCRTRRSTEPSISPADESWAQGRLGAFALAAR